MLIVKAMRAVAAHRVSAQCVLRSVVATVTGKGLPRMHCHCAGTTGEVSRKREPCKKCWSRELGTRRLDGVALNRRTNTGFTSEFKRTTNRAHGYAQHCDKRATDQYAGLKQAAHQKKKQRIKWRNVEGGLGNGRRGGPVTATKEP